MIRTLSAMVLATTMLAATALAATPPPRQPGFLSYLADTIVNFMRQMDFDPRGLSAPANAGQEGDDRALLE